MNTHFAIYVFKILLCAYIGIDLIKDTGRIIISIIGIVEAKKDIDTEGIMQYGRSLVIDITVFIIHIIIDVLLILIMLKL